MAEGLARLLEMRRAGDQSLAANRAKQLAAVPPARKLPASTPTLAIDQAGASSLDRTAKRGRSAKRQLGQFLTPTGVASHLVASSAACRRLRILEPSFGTGSFLVPLIERLLAEQESGTVNARLGRIVSERVWGVELDARLYERAIHAVERRWGKLPAEHNLELGDYFRFEPGMLQFDLIIGNPPFGGTFDAGIEDALDRRFGRYQGDKAKKETYSFFTAKAVGEAPPARRAPHVHLQRHLPDDQDHEGLAAAPDGQRAMPC